MTPMLLNAALLLGGHAPEDAGHVPMIPREAIVAHIPTAPVTAGGAHLDPMPRLFPTSDPGLEASAPTPGPGEVAVPPASPVDVAADQAEEIVVSGRRRSKADPVEKVNIQSYKAVQALDGAAVAPLARGYKKAVPKPVRRGIHNFLDNIQEPIVFLNYLLQLKPGKAVETLGRFAVNSTVGIAGVVDVAKKKPFNLPHRANSLANTLGYYGVGPGPYLFLPLIGPTTLRDLLGTVGDRLVLPTAVGAPFDKAAFTIPANVLSALDYRVAFDESLQKLHDAPDPYAATRATYLARRRAEIDNLHSVEWRSRRAQPASGGATSEILPVRPSASFAADERTGSPVEAPRPTGAIGAETSNSPTSAGTAFNDAGRGSPAGRVDGEGQDIPIR